MLLRGGLILGLGALAVGCPSPAPTDAGVDAGHDAGRDAGVDSGTDAGTHAPEDAGADAGVDGGPRDPGWVLLPGLPEACPIERAEHPERLLSIDWEPCPGHPPGCLREVGRGVVTQPRVGWHDGDHGYFFAIVGEAPRAVVLVRTDGVALAAWRDPPINPDDSLVCAVHPTAVGDGYAAVVARSLDFDSPSTSREVVYWALIDEIGDAPALGVIELGLNRGQWADVSRDIVAVEEQPGGVVVAMGLDGQMEVLFSDEVQGIPQHARVVGEHVFWEDWADLTRIAHATLGNEATILHRADPGDIKHFHADEDGMAWIQGYDRPPGPMQEYARIELWAAPLAYDAATLEPRLVATLPQRGLSAYGGGWYVMYVGSPKRLMVIRVEDGTQREWIPPEPYGVGHPPLYVSDHEMLVASGDGTRGFLLRIDPHTLPLVEP